MYRLRILEGEIAQEVSNCVHAFSEQKKCEINELNVQKDHVHLVVMVSPKLSISDYLGIIKGRTVIRVFNKFRKLKTKPYCGNHFWSKGYCVDIVGLDEGYFCTTPRKGAFQPSYRENIRELQPSGLGLRS